MADKAMASLEVTMARLGPQGVAMAPRLMEVASPVAMAAVAMAAVAMAAVAMAAVAMAALAMAILATANLATVSRATVPTAVVMTRWSAQASQLLCC